MPERSLRGGQPAGSAVPLVWAHAEYLKLLRSALDGKVFDLIDPVYERYCDAEGRKKRRCGVEMYSRRRPVESIRRGKILRILDEGRFEATWTDDGWQTVHTVDSRNLGSAGYSADIAPAEGGGELEWTLHWPGKDVWLGYNVKVKVDAS
jgi:glucoamylase